MTEMETTPRRKLRRPSCVPSTVAQWNHRDYDPGIHAELNDNGEIASGQDEESYSQVSRSGSDDKVVYTVAGSTGKVSDAALDHPAHVAGFVELGSVLIEAGASEMTATFINDKGAVLDYVTITR